MNFVIRLRCNGTTVTDLCGNTWSRYGATPQGSTSPIGKNDNSIGMSGNAENGNDGWLELRNRAKSLDYISKWTIAWWQYNKGFGRYRGNWSYCSDTDELYNFRVASGQAGGWSSFPMYNAPIKSNEWHYHEVNYDGSILRIFVDGKLIGTCDKKTSSKIFTNTSRFIVGQYSESGNYDENAHNGYIYDFVVIDGIWHTDSYDLLQDYARLDSIGLVSSKTPINLLDKTKVKGFSIEGIEPANTNRRVAFKVDDKWNKLTTDGALSELTTQAITSDSVLAEGNTIAELTALTNVPSLAGKLVYPAIALYASEEATAMPTFGLKANTITDRNKNSITSPAYHISDTEITITDITANKKIVGDAGINIVASIKNSSGWSFYTDIDNIISKKATDIKFIYTFYVKECNEKNSAHLIDIAINYDQDNPTATLSGDFKISPLIFCINEEKNGLTRYKFNYVERDNNSANSVRRCFAKSLYELPQKAGGELINNHKINNHKFLFRLRAMGDNQMQDLCGNSFGKESDGDGWHLAAGPFGAQDAFHVITEDADHNGWFYCTRLKDEAFVKSYAGNFTITFWVKYDYVLTSNSGDAILCAKRSSGNWDAEGTIGITQNAVIVEGTKIPLKKSIVNETWYFFEFSLSNNTWYVFCDGQYLGSGACSMGSNFYLNQNTFYTGHGNANNHDDEFMGYLADFCVIGGQWHSPGTTYEKPTAYLTE